MSESVADQTTPTTTNTASGVTIRHGELGIGFNSLQERYVSTVTCQEPWTVRAVSYDSKLFKELATIWKFTPNVPKTTTLEATMDQELHSNQLLTKPAEYPAADMGKQSLPPAPIEYQFTAAKVFGEAAVPKYWIQTPPSTSTQNDTSTSTYESSSPLNLKNSVERTPSPSNLATMKPSDYPSCWIDFEIQFEFSSPVHASMSSLFFDQVSKEMLEAFIKQAEVLYGQREKRKSRIDP
ncbi:Coenzyme Q-binding protein coq10a, mitochondrial [Entomortierella beljakovae]|nr:Coenzyme Q-binding protein coq10a, mitochondrial [Entomortierella beljakovae]